MGREWATLWKPSAGLPPTRWVGESGVMRSGCSASRALRRFMQGVVLGVGEHGGVEDVVEVLVVAELVAQGGDLLGGADRFGSKSTRHGCSV